MKIQVELVRADAADAAAIRDLMVTVEQEERRRWYTEGSGPYIPGFDSVDMHQYHLWNDSYFKIMVQHSLVGVVLISYTGREHARIDRLYIDPSQQNKGIGSAVISSIEALYPEVRLWTLDTDQNSPRNHHFYEKMGYQLAGQDDKERYYFKNIPGEEEEAAYYTRSRNLGSHNFRDCNLHNTDFHDVNLQEAKFTNLNMSHTLFQNSNSSYNRFTNVNLSHSVFGDSNMSQTEICHVNLAGAYIHDTSLGTDQPSLPVAMERCDLANSTIADSNLRNVAIVNSNIEGMTIDGISVSELLATYKKQQAPTPSRFE